MYISDKPRWETIHAPANSSKNHRQFIYHQACDKPVTGTTEYIICPQPVMHTGNITLLL